jgi:deoxyribodipyrimidine photolyase-related protein
MPYRTLNKMTDEKRQSIQHDAQIFLKALDNNEEV